MSKKDKHVNEEKIDRWTIEINDLKNSIKDKAAQIAGGFIEIPSSELIVMLEFINKEIEMINDFQALIGEEKISK